MDLEKLRDQINEIDSQMVDLFCRRMELVNGVAQYKISNGLAVYHADRERQVLERVRAQATPGHADQTAALFQTMMDISKVAQQAYLANQGKQSPLAQRITQALAEGPAVFVPHQKVAVAGIKGAYSYHAANRMLQTPDITCYPTFEDVFRAVESGREQLGVVPIENSSAGAVGDVYDLLNKYDLTICKTYKYPVNHCLLAKPGVSIDQVRDVYSHEQGISQCYTFLHERPQITTHAYANTAMAAQFVANSQVQTDAAIASQDCAALYGLEILAQNLQDAKHNYTRFICISKTLQIPQNADKISLVLSLPHVPGALYRMISRLALNELNLTKIESRPILNTDFEFLFYFDLDGSVKDARLVSLLCALEDELEYFKFLGNYA